MSLAFLAEHPERVRSVALGETPWIGNDIWSEMERSFVASFDGAVALPPTEMVPAVFDLLSPGVELPADPSTNVTTNPSGGQSSAGFPFRSAPRTVP